MKIAPELAKAEQARQWIQHTLYGLELPRTAKTLFAAGCFDTVIEHQQGISYLLARKLFAPAFSLARPVFETYVRGLWLSYCANDADLERFKKDKVKPSLAQIIEELEAFPQFSEGVLSKARSAGFDYLSSFTHGGLQQIMRRIGVDAVEPQYHEEDQVEVLRFATSHVWLAGIEIANLSENLQLAEDILQKSIEYAQSTA